MKTKFVLIVEFGFFLESGVELLVVLKQGVGWLYLCDSSCSVSLCSKC